MISEPRSPDAAVHADGLVKRYRGAEHPAVNGLSMTVASGSVCALLGANGAGKTTVVRLLTTLLRPDAGQVTVFGADLLTEPHKVRSSIAICGQYAALDGRLTARENLTMIARLARIPKSVARTRSEELLEEFGLSESKDKPVARLSGGTARRVDLAASLIIRPRLLFLDEPTTGLDPRARLQIWDVIEGMVSSGTTVLLTTQYLEEAERLADEVTVIHQGRVVVNGTPDQLKREAGAFRLEIRLTAAADSAHAVGPRPPLEAAVALVSSMNLLGEATTVDRSGLIVVSLQDHQAMDVVAELTRRLADSHIEVEEMALRKPSLEEVFLALSPASGVLDSRTGVGP